MKIYSVRGATTISEDSVDYISKETKSLLTEIMIRNKIDLSDIINVIFTCTKDISKAYPAKFARDIGFENIPLMCLQEMHVEGSLEMCIRVMITVHSSHSSQIKAKHVYLNKAKMLRPDLDIE